MKYVLNFLIAVLCLPFGVWAHGYWIETEGTHKPGAAVVVKLYFGDYVAGERLSGKTLDKMKDIKVFVTTPKGDRQQVEMKQGEHYWEGVFLPQGDGAYLLTGINDVREVQDWTKHNLGIVRPIQYLQAVYTVGKERVTPPVSQFLSVIVSQRSKKKYEITVLKDGAPSPEGTLVFTSFGGSEQTLSIKNGKADITVKTPGTYLLSTEWIDNTPGDFKDKHYETIRHRADYTLVHEG